MPWEYIAVIAGVFLVGWIAVFVFGLVVIHIRAWHICIGLPLLGWVWLVIMVAGANSKYDGVHYD